MPRAKVAWHGTRVEPLYHRPIRLQRVALPAAGACVPACSWPDRRRSSIPGRPAGIPAGGPASAHAGAPLCAAFALAIASCGPWVPLPEHGSHDGDEPVFVPEAPPPPQVQIIPARPEEPDTIVWVDGQWIWRGRRWEWEPGKWEVPQPGATYAPPKIVYLADKRIAWFAGRWHAPAAR